MTVPILRVNLEGLKNKATSSNWTQFLLDRHLNIHATLMRKVLKMMRTATKAMCHLTKDGSTVRYIQSLRTTYLAPGAVPYFSLIFEAYRANVPYPYYYKKGVPYHRTLLFSKNWGIPYRTAILAHDFYQWVFDYLPVTVLRLMFFLLL